MSSVPPSCRSLTGHSQCQVAAGQRRPGLRLILEVFARRHVGVRFWKLAGVLLEGVFRHEQLPMRKYIRHVTEERPVPVRLDEVEGLGVNLVMGILPPPVTGESVRLAPGVSG